MLEDKKLSLVILFLSPVSFGTILVENRQDLTTAMLQIKPSNTLRAPQTLYNCTKKMGETFSS